MQLDLFAAAQAPREEPGTTSEARSVSAAPPTAAVQPAVGFSATFQPSEPKVAHLGELHAMFTVGSLTHHRMAKIRSALNGVARVLGRPLDQLPADLTQLRPLLKSALPATAGVRPRRWAEIRSDLYLALRVAGTPIVPLRDETALTPRWTRLLSQAGRRLQTGLGHFARFCVRRGLEPDAVDAGTFTAFLEELEAQSLHDRPRYAHREALKHWNKAAKAVAGWPQRILPVTTDPRQYALPWETFPDRLVAEIEEFLQAKELGDEFDDDPAPRLRSATLKARRPALRRICSALVLSGVPASELTSLAVLCEPEKVRIMLRFMRDRHPSGGASEGQMTHGHLLKTVARHWLDDQAAARQIGKILRPKEKELKGLRSSIRPKNRKRLRQFDERRSMDALMTLPMRTLRRISKIPQPSCFDAVKVRHALVLAIAQYTPIRIRSLAELEIGENILDYGKGARRQVRIFLPEEKTKNSRAYEAPLPKHIYPLLDAWLATYRPRLCPHVSSYLFPNSRGGLMDRDGLGRSACRFLEQDSSIRMNMHLFRHLTAKVILEYDPNAMETVRQILGHESVRTTEKAYAELKTDPAFAKLDATYDQLRSALKRRPRKPTKPRGGKSGGGSRGRR